MSTFQLCKFFAQKIYVFIPISVHTQTIHFLFLQYTDGNSSKGLIKIRLFLFFHFKMTWNLSFSILFARKKEPREMMEFPWITLKKVAKKNWFYLEFPVNT